MDEEELERLAGDLESDRVERKPSLAQSKEIRQAICAFANDLPKHGRPGVLLIGLNDDASFAGLAVDDPLLRKLADIRGEGTLMPMPVLTVQRRPLRDHEVAVVLVEPAAAPPVRYNGRVFVRVGPSRRVASPEEERVLTERRRSRDLPFDLRPVLTASLEDLDDDLFRRVYLPSAVAPEILAENRRSLGEQLAALRFATAGAPPQPTVAGCLVVGRDPRRFLPCDYIQFLRIAGKDLTDPIKDQKEIDGPLAQLLRLLDETLEINISVASDVTSAATEIAHPDYPLVALQQLARNAVLHRNYEGTNAPVRITWFDDRVEIMSPGGPFGQVSQERFGEPGLTDYRNPNLAEAMKTLGYVQRFGIGIPTARSELEKNGNPPPEFKAEMSWVLVTVRRRE